MEQKKQTKQTKKDHRDIKTPNLGNGRQGLSRREALNKKEPPKDARRPAAFRDAPELPKRESRDARKPVTAKGGASEQPRRIPAERKSFDTELRHPTALSTKKQPEKEQKEIRQPKIKVLYEDNDIIIIDKPANMLVIPSPANEQVTLTTLVDTYLKLKDPNGPSAHPCHRLDRDTTGIIIFAKGKANQKKVMNEFHEHKVSKKYLALVNGVPKEKAGKIDTSIEEMEAVTKYKLIEAYSGFSLMQFEPVTGRTNQIRIHAKSINHHLIGERKYSFGKDSRFKFSRIALHASAVGFRHPVTGNLMSFQSPLPADMARFIEKNRNLALPVMKEEEKIIHKKLERKAKKAETEKKAPTLKEGEKSPAAEIRRERQKRIQKKFYEKQREGSRERNKKRER